jgi:ferredoxin
MTPDCRITWRFSDGTEIETDGYSVFNILAHAEIYEYRIAQACGGQAECGTCRFRVSEGELSPVLADEAHLREEHAASFEDSDRLACRARPLSDLVIEVRGRAPADLREA